VTIQGYSFPLGDYFFEEIKAPSLAYELTQENKQIDVQLKSAREFFINGQKMSQDVVIYNYKLKHPSILLPILSQLPDTMMPATGEEWTIFLSLLGYDIIVYALIIFELRRQSQLKRRRRLNEQKNHEQERTCEE